MHRQDMKTRSRNVTGNIYDNLHIEHKCHFAIAHKRLKRNMTRPKHIELYTLQRYRCYKYYIRLLQQSCVDICFFVSLNTFQANINILMILDCSGGFIQVSLKRVVRRTQNGVTSCQGTYNYMNFLDVEFDICIHLQRKVALYGYC